MVTAYPNNAFAVNGSWVFAATMTSEGPNEDAISEADDEVLTTPATPGAEALPTTEPADEAGGES